MEEELLTNWDVIVWYLEPWEDDGFSPELAKQYWQDIYEDEQEEIKKPEDLGGSRGVVEMA